MEFLSSALFVLFLALMIAAAVTFGFALLVWFVAVAMLLGTAMLLRQWWWRWRFLRSARKQEPPGVIEGEYKDISDKEEL